MEVALFEPPPLKASPDVVVFTGSAHPDEGETGQLKRCTCIREAYLSHRKLPFIIITFEQLSWHMVFYSDLEVRWQ